MAKRRKKSSESENIPADPFAVSYPHVASWVQDGWIEVGRDDFSRSFVRALDIGGMIWEGKPSYPTLHAAFSALDRGIAEWLDEHG